MLYGLVSSGGCWSYHRKEVYRSLITQSSTAYRLLLIEHSKQIVQ
jgi:hypothetical protein